MTLPSRFGPYKQLPRIYYTGRGPSVGNSLENGNIGLNLLGHYVNYEKDDSLTGNVVSLRPNINYTYYRPFLNVRSKFEIQHNQYLLDDPNRVFDDNESYTVPKFSIEKLFSEQYQYWTDRLSSNLEPRLYYLFVPNTDFDHIPNFGSGLHQFEFRIHLQG